jgi:anti-anti-sigma factor
METLLLRPETQTSPVFVREFCGTALVLNPTGSLGNLHEAEIAQETLELLDFIIHSEHTNLIIDLRNADQLGTVVLGSVVRLWKRVAQRGGRLALCNVSENVVQVLRVTKLHAVWPIYATREEALRIIGA